MPDTQIPQVGANAPDFELPDGNNQPVRLRGLKGKPVVLYFYPKYNMPLSNPRKSLYINDLQIYQYHLSAVWCNFGAIVWYRLA